MSDIKKIVEDAIPLDMKCEITRSEQLKRRAKLRMDIEELLRVVKVKVGPSEIKS